MSMQHIFAGSSISSSGLSAERTRMEVAANNIANANTTRGTDGEPYRRQTVTFAASMDQYFGAPNSVKQLGGVKVLGIEPDMSEPDERICRRDSCQSSVRSQIEESADVSRTRRTGPVAVERN